MVLFVFVTRFHICYWMSVSMQRGFELNCGRLTLSSEHALRLVPVDDGLKHRPKSDWSIVFLTCELQDAEIWLQSALGPDSEDNSELNVSLRQPVEKFYFLSVQRVSYGREAALTPSFGAHGTSSNVPTHRLVVQVSFGTFWEFQLEHFLEQFWNRIFVEPGRRAIDW